MTEKKHKSKHDLVKRITEVTDIRSDVVYDVLEGLVSVAIEDVCSNDGHFRIADLLTVSPEKVRGYETKLSTIPPHKRLRPRLSTLPKIMYKIQQDHFADEPGIITAENWRDVFNHYTDDQGHNYSFSNAQKTSHGLDAETPEETPGKTSQKQPVPNFQKIADTPAAEPPSERTKPATVAPRRSKSSDSARPVQPPHSEPYNPFLDDDDDE